VIRTGTIAGRDTFMTVEVHDPHGHRSVLLEGMRSSTPVSEILARAMSELRVPSEVGLEWNLRHQRSGRLLQHEQRLGEFAEADELVSLKMQPDAGLG
jgi:hypothetical protein